MRWLLLEENMFSSLPAFLDLDRRKSLKHLIYQILISLFFQDSVKILEDSKT